MRVHSLDLGFLLVCLVVVGSFCNAEDDQTFEIVGVADCADCQYNNFNPSHAFSGLHVSIDCKLKIGEIKRVGDGELDEGGQFKISVPKEVIQDGQNLKKCYAQLHNAGAIPCPAHDGLDTTKIVFKSQIRNKITFSPEKALRFSTALCTSKFLWPLFQYPPLPKTDPWKKNWPEITIPPLKDFGHPWSLTPTYKPKPKPTIYKPFPPIYKPKPPVYKPLPPNVPIYKPLPPSVPIYKPVPKPPVPIYKPIPKLPVPIYKPLPPPVPIYKPIPKLPVPIYKPLPPPVPIYKPIPKPSVPIYKPLPPPVPIYKPIPKPPVPIYKPLPPPVPMYKPIPKPPVPIYKPLPPPVPIYKSIPKPPVPFYIPIPKTPVPIYKPPVEKPLPPPIPVYETPTVTKPLPPPFPLFPLPPLYKKPCPPFTKIPPKYFNHPKFGYIPKLPPFDSNINP